MMDSEIVKAALGGAKITIESDCWPLGEVVNTEVRGMAEIIETGRFFTDK